MGRYRLEGNPPITVQLRRSGRARRLSLRVSQLDGRVTLTLPAGVPERAATTFIKERESWLRGHLADVAPVVPVTVGVALSVGGKSYEVASLPGARAVLTDRQIRVNAARPIGPQVQALLREEARRALVVASDRYAAALGVSYKALRLRDTRSRWGSCTAEGALMYSWRLIMAPPAVLDYVAAHEVAHLVEMNHQPAFWALVAQLYPGYAAQRSWLHSHGPGLHRYRFTD